QGAEHPVVEEGVGALEAQALDERGGHRERVGDRVARLDEHRPAARDPPHDRDPVLLGTLGVDLVAQRLERTDHDRGARPLPDAQRRSALPRPDRLGLRLVEGHVHRRILRALVHDLEGVVLPAGRVTKRAAHRDRDRLGVETHEHDLGPEHALDHLGQLGDARRVGHAEQRTVDRLERLVRLEEEVAAHRGVRDAPVGDLEVDRHELATGNLVLASHRTSVGRTCGDGACVWANSRPGRRRRREVEAPSSAGSGGRRRRREVRGAVVGEEHPRSALRAYPGRMATERPEHSQGGTYTVKGKEFERDTRYIPTRITRDGAEGYPVEPGRYRLVAARACPWANRTVIVRRLLGLEDEISLALPGPTHDKRSLTFDLDPGGRDPALRIERLHEADLKRLPDYPRGITVPAIVDVPSGEVVTNDFAQITLDFSTEWVEHHRPGAPDLLPEQHLEEIFEVNDRVFREVNNGVYRCG